MPGIDLKKLRIIGTSDLHGKFMPWDYALNQESNTGSMAQLYTAIKEYRDDTTLLVDAGDTIQDNFAEIFIDEDIHPMILALNTIGYDIWVTGNHDYNYGMDIVKKTIRDLNSKVLVGNVYDNEGNALADGYVILEKAGLRVALIGMVTPNIIRWDKVNLEGYTVTDPLHETRRIIESINGQYDVLIGVFHMGIKNENGVENSGVTDICNACPEFDVMISSHEHTLIKDQRINGVLVVQNKAMAQSMAVIDLVCTKNDVRWTVVEKSTEIIDVGQFAPNPKFQECLCEYDKKARKDAETIIGTLYEGPLAPENEIADIPCALLQDTALINLINEVQMYYTGTAVSASALSTMDANMQPGPIRKCDVAHIYKYTNTLYKLRMTGAQLKKYMEWCAQFYNLYHDKDLTISFNPEMPTYNYDIFDGILYEINISKEPGSRIENLLWPDGREVRADDVFDIAVNHYRANSHLLVSGEIYSKNDVPKLLEMDVRGDLGGIRELIRDYIVNVKGGEIRPVLNHNWRITGTDWDPELHQKCVNLLKEGKLKIDSSSDGKIPNVRSITVEEVIRK